MADMQTVFSTDTIDRCGALRSRPKALARAFADPATRFVPLWRNLCLIRGGRAALLGLDAIREHAPTAEQAVFLGRREQGYLFAAAIDDALRPDPPDDARFTGLRELSHEVVEKDAALLAYARAMLIWHATHRHCGRCGAINQTLEGGFVLQCSNAACRHRSFPRLDPAIIVLVQREDTCLLGRQGTWPAGLFSTIAGFVEPGESLENAVRREVREETNIRVVQCTYLASQPWPFPAALMIGFHAQAESAEILLNDGELQEARWLTRAQIAAGEVTVSPRMSIAYRLIEAWFDAVPGPRLATLGVDARSVSGAR